jgi:hypothetical protein
VIVLLLADAGPNETLVRRNAMPIPCTGTLHTWETRYPPINDKTAGFTPCEGSFASSR